MPHPSPVKHTVEKNTAEPPPHQMQVWFQRHVFPCWLRSWSMTDRNQLSVCRTWISNCIPSYTGVRVPITTHHALRNCVVCYYLSVSTCMYRVWFYRCNMWCIIVIGTEQNQRNNVQLSEYLTQETFLHESKNNNYDESPKGFFDLHCR